MSEWLEELREARANSPLKKGTSHEAIRLDVLDRLIKIAERAEWYPDSDGKDYCSICFSPETNTFFKGTLRQAGGHKRSCPYSDEWKKG